MTLDLKCKLVKVELSTNQTSVHAYQPKKYALQIKLWNNLLAGSECRIQSAEL